MFIVQKLTSMQFLISLKQTDYDTIRVFATRIDRSQTEAFMILLTILFDNARQANEILNQFKPEV